MKAALINAVLVGSGGFLGALARYGLSGLVHRQVPLTTFPYGTLVVNLKLVGNVLTLLRITTPYTTDGGNLTLEFTIQAADVRGAAQVFSSDFAFGTYPLQVR